jgi:hypothetical protein
MRLSVISCSDYADRRRGALLEMEEIAWRMFPANSAGSASSPLIVVDKKRAAIFRSPPSQSLA